MIRPKRLIDHMTNDWSIKWLNCTIKWRTERLNY